MATKHGMVACRKGLPPMNLHNPLNVWSRDFTWKLKTLHLYYDIVYGQQIYQGSDIPRGAHIHKLAWPPNEVVLWYHMIN